MNHYEEVSEGNKDDEDDDTSNAAGSQDEPCTISYCNCPYHKKKGVIGDHVVFSFIDRRTQPLQLRKHPAFRYEGTQDPTRMSSEPLAQSEVIKRCCKVLDNFQELCNPHDRSCQVVLASV